MRKDENKLGKVLNSTQFDPNVDATKKKMYVIMHNIKQ